MLKSGVDIVGFLEMIGTSQKILDYMRSVTVQFNTSDNSDCKSGTQRLVTMHSPMPVTRLPHLLGNDALDATASLLLIDQVHCDGGRNHHGCGKVAEHWLPQTLFTVEKGTEEEL